MRRDIRVFDVSLRDGLQNESRRVSLNDKIWFAQELAKAGILDLELGAFVRKERVPQMADSDEFYRQIELGRVRLGRSKPWCLVPNDAGLTRALKVGATRIAVFTAATESFVQKNIGMSIRESLDVFRGIIERARVELGSSLEVRGYVSTAFGCPFEGKVRPSQALRVAEKLFHIGVKEVSIGDTIGVGTPRAVANIISPALKIADPKSIAVHFHDTRGTALANTLRALELGITTIDASAAGLGGCPFAPGATGNLATEDLVYMLHGMGLRTGIDLESLCTAGVQFSKRIKRPITSRYLNAYLNSRSSCF